MKKQSPDRKILKINPVNIDNYMPVNSRVYQRPTVINDVQRPHIQVPNAQPIIEINNNIKYEKPIGDFKIAIVLNLFYSDTSLKYYEKLANLRKTFNFDLYVNFVKNSHASAIENKNLFSKLNANLFSFDNYGKDIYPKLNILKHIYDKGVKYDYVFLMHDKKSNQYDKSRSKWMITWEEELTSLLFDDNLRNFSLGIFESDKNIGMIGNKKHLHYGPGWHNKLKPNRHYNETELIKHYSTIKNQLPKERLARSNGNWFIGGTMFWVRWECLQVMLSSININVINHYLSKDIGDIRDPSFTHAFERFFGYIPLMSSKTLVGI